MINIAVRDLDGQVHEIEAHDGDSLMETLREFEWGVPAICGGLCSCGTCHVYLDVFESTHENSRLSCQLQLRPDHDGLKLSIAPEE